MLIDDIDRLILRVRPDSNRAAVLRVAIANWKLKREIMRRLKPITNLLSKWNQQQQ